jgi:hypothetical protein
MTCPNRHAIVVTEVLLVGQPLEPGTRQVRPVPIELPDEFAHPVDVVAHRPSLGQPAHSWQPGMT